MSKQSVEQFLELIRTGEHTNKRHDLFVFLSGKRMTLQDLRASSGMPHQTLTSALSDLQDMGLVMQNDEGLFYHTPKEERKFQAMLREQAKYNRWLKKGHENGWFQPNGTPKPPQPRRVVLSKQLSILDVL